MHIAWLRPAPDAADPLDPSAELITALGAQHRLEVIDSVAAHDLVWRHAREPFDLFVHELSAAPGHAFVAAYAVHFPGILLLRDFAPHSARAIQASRTVVVTDQAVAASLRESYPATRIVASPAVGVRPGSDPIVRATQPIDTGRGNLVRFGLLTGREEIARRAVDRARAAAPDAELLTGQPAEVLEHADVIIALDWPPPAGPPQAALAALTAGKPVIVLETLATAAWPAFDPQTWQPRGFAPPSSRGETPIAVSLDPRDEEHSLVLAVTRLAAEPDLRATLAAAALAWAGAHAKPAHAVEAWRRILDAPGLPPSPPFPGADGSEHLRATLAEFGVTVDLP